MTSCIIKNFPCKQKAALFMSEFRFCLLNVQIPLLLQHSQPSAVVLITQECESLFVEVKKKSNKIGKVLNLEAGRQNKVCREFKESKRESKRVKS